MISMRNGNTSLKYQFQRSSLFKRGYNFPRITEAFLGSEFGLKNVRPSKVTIASLWLRPSISSKVTALTTLLFLLLSKLTKSKQILLGEVLIDWRELFSNPSTISHFSVKSSSPIFKVDSTVDTLKLVLKIWYRSLKLSLNPQIVSNIQP